MTGGPSVVVETLDQAMALAREYGGTLWRWCDGYWSPANPADHLATAVTDLGVRMFRVPPAIARAITQVHHVDDSGPGCIILTGRAR